MRNRITRSNLDASLMVHGWRLVLWSPGDGTTRYRIAQMGEDYFSAPARPTAMGLAEARLMVEAFLRGLSEGRNGAQA